MAVSIKQTSKKSDIKTNAPKTNTVKRLFQLLNPHRKLFVVAMIALVLGSSVNLLFPAVIRRLLNEDYNFYFIKYSWATSAFLIALFCIQAICFYFRSLYFGVIGQRVVNDLRKKMYSSIIAQEIPFFDQAKTGDLVSALSSDAVLIQEAVSVKLSVFIRYTFQVIFGLALMLLLSPLLTGLITICVPLLIFTSRILGKKLKYWSRMQQENLGAGSAIASESFSNIKVVKAYNRENLEATRFSSSLENVLSAGIQRSKVSAFYTSFISFLLNVLLVLLLFYGFQRVAQNTLSLGDLTAFILYGVIVAVSFAFVVNSYSEFVQSVAASERVFEFLDLGSAAPLDETQVFKAGFNPEISLSNLSFYYPARPEIAALEGVELKIEAGKITALVGPSGAGKTTIVNLILKFYPPSAGTILVSGTDIAGISSHELRNKITYVPQEPQLFAMSIESNLLYAKPEASRKEIEEICVQTNLLEFINSLPKGFDTEIGERGVQLSAGQKQRIAIARAMLRNPEILILDEATASLDSQNEFLIQQSLEKLMKGKTTLIIAHRLSTVKAADKVVVLDKGRIIQSGTHESLSSIQGLYRDFVQKQELAAN
jgi:ABC-type multidrug transport system fused ATPase/permease subunit